MTDTIEPLQVWLCISCTRYTEYPSKCTLCGAVILSQPVRVELAILQKITDLLFLAQKTEAKK